MAKLNLLYIYIVNAIAYNRNTTKLINLILEPHELSAYDIGLSVAKLLVMKTKAVGHLFAHARCT